MKHTQNIAHEIRRKVAPILFACAAVSTILAAQAANMRPGQYEITSEMAMAGRGMKTPPRKDVTCVTAEMMRDWSSNLVKTSGGVTCKVAEYKATGNTLAFVRQCATDQGKTTTYKGDVTFAPPDTYDAVIAIAGSDGASPLNGATITMTAKRVGDCAK